MKLTGTGTLFTQESVNVITVLLYGLCFKRASKVFFPIDENEYAACTVGLNF
jgi:hypothetical protein